MKSAMSRSVNSHVAMQTDDKFVCFKKWAVTPRKLHGLFRPINVVKVDNSANNSL